MKSVVKNYLHRLQLALPAWAQEWRKRKKMHQEKGSTRKEVIKKESNPDLYQLEDRSSNRSHKHEQKDK